MNQNLTSSTGNSGDVESERILPLLRRVDGILRRIAREVVESGKRTSFHSWSWRVLPDLRGGGNVVEVEYLLGGRQPVREQGVENLIRTQPSPASFVYLSGN